jgi:uncharacterized membrane protein
MGEPETTAHGLTGIIGELNEEYENEYGDELIAEDDGSLTGYKFAFDDREYDVSGDIQNILEQIVSDGEKMLVLDQYGSDTVAVHEYSFGEKWDLSTITYEGDALSIGTEIDEPNGIDTDGETLLVCDSDAEDIYEYSFGSPWEVESLSGPDGSFTDVSNQDGSPRGITTDGSVLIVAGATSDELYQYSFGTDWDVTTLSYDNTSYNIAGETSSPRGLYSDGEYLIYINSDENNIQQYNFGTGWDLSTLTHYATADSSPANGSRGITSGGGVVIVSDANDDKLYSYSYVPEVRIPER